MGKGFVVAAVILILVGGLWMLQGIGLVGGSFMTGERHWFWIGLVTCLVGAALLIWSGMNPGRKPR